MLRRLLAPLALLLSLLPATAQSYQTQFSEVKFDRSKGPGTIHGGVQVDTATGHVTMNLPLGPGIGTRGLKYQPVLAGRWAPQAEVYNDWRFDPYDHYELDPQGVHYIELAATPFELYRNVYSGGFSLTPGELHLVLDQEPFPSLSFIPQSKPGIQRLSNYTSPDGFSGTLEVENADPGRVPTLEEALSLARIYGFGEGWEVAWMPYTNGGGGGTQRFIRRGSAGELVVGLVHASLSPLHPAVDLVAADGAVTGVGSNTQANAVWFPTTMLVIRDDAATVYNWTSDRYDKVDIQSSTPRPWIRSFMPKANYYYMRWASFRVGSLRNRFGDEIRFSSTGDKSFRAECFQGGTSTGTAVNVTPNRVTYEGPGALPSYALSLAGKEAPFSNPRSTDGTALIVTPYQYPTYAGYRAQLDLSPPSAYDGFKDQLLGHLTDETTQESVSATYSYASFTGVAALDLQLPASFDLAGRKVGLTWERYEFFSNQPDAQGLASNHDLAAASTSVQAGYSMLPVYTWGVTKVVDEQPMSTSTYGTPAQKITQYTRVVPSPSRRTGSLWTNTSFYVITNLPGGQSTLTRYQEPLANRTALESDATQAEKIQTLAYLKHQVAEVRTYAAGVDPKADVLTGTLLGQPYLKDPSTSTAHKIDLFDRWDLRSPANPNGEINRSSVPASTRSRTWEGLNKILKTTESLDWDVIDLGWRHTLTRTESASVPPSGIDVLSLFARGQQYFSASGTDVIERITERGFETKVSQWMLGWTTEEQASITQDSSLGRAASLGSMGMPVAGPKTTQVLDSIHPEFSRVASVQVQGGNLSLSTGFTFKGDSGAQASQRATATLSGSGLLSGQVGVAAYDYDNFGFLNRIQSMGAGFELKQSNDSFGRATSQTDPNALVTSIGWDGASRLRAINPGQGELGTSIEPSGDNLGWTVTKGQQSSTYRYNRFGQLILERRKRGEGQFSFKAFGYDSAGRPTGETVWIDGTGDETWWMQANLTSSATVITGFIPAHWECIKEDDLGNCLKRVWVADETQTSTLPALAKGLSIRYDGFGREISRTDANGGVTSTTYGERSKAVTVAPGTPAAMTTHFVTDSAGRLIKVVDAKSQVTTYGYDPLDRVVEVRQYPASSGIGASAVGAGTAQLRQWAYDALGRTVVLDQPESGVTYYTAFTVLGKPTKTVYGLPRGWRPASVDAEDASAFSVSGVKTLATTFDAQGRVTSVRSSDGTVDHTLTYDEGGAPALANGKLTTAATGKGVARQLKYNGAGGLNGRLTELVRTVDGLTFNQAFAWNLDGTLKSRSTPGGRVQTLAYDAARGLPTGTSLDGANLATLAYDPVHWGLTGLTFGNNASSFFTYGDDQTRLKAMTHAIPGGGTRAWNYAYDSASRLIGDGEDYYTYDALGRLTSALVMDPWAQNTSGTRLQQILTYDPFGNRTALSSLLANVHKDASGTTVVDSTTALPGADQRDLRSYTMNAPEIAAMAAANRLPSSLGGVATGALYDPLGNLTNLYRIPGQSGTQLSLGYDALGRVATLGDSAQATSQTYLHDDEGLRIRIFDSRTGKTTYNIYNEARQLVATYEKVGTGPLTWKKDIVYVGTKEVAEVDSTGKTWTTFVDHLGSPRLIWNGQAPANSKPDGLNLIEQKFMPFGESLADPNSAAKFAKGFTNHEQTDASGLIYMQARFYAPWFGRFMSPDPALDQHFEHTQKWNIYSYVSNNPVMKIDSDGMIEREMFGDMRRDGAWKNMAPLRDPGEKRVAEFVTGGLGLVALPAVVATAEGSGAAAATTGLLARLRTALGLGGPKAADLAQKASQAGPAAQQEAQALQRGAQAAEHIVLGLRNFGLQNTAAQVGGKTLLNDSNWVQTFKQALANPNTRFTVSLDGLKGSSVYGQVMSAVQQGAQKGASPTNWEMNQLYQAGRLATVQFVQNGQPVANPFVK